MDPVILSKAEIKKIILHAAGLAKRAPFGKGREAVFKLIDHLGFLQIDTNYVVERAHHHTIFARVPDYKLEWLQELQADARIYEFLTSDSGFMPMEEFRFSLPVKASFAANRKPVSQSEINLMNNVLDTISRDGPMMVKDFDNDRQVASAGWWDWRPSKVALERLYLDGKLMATRTKEFHKLYDLPRNLVPEEIDTEPPTQEEFARHIIRRSLQSMGVAFAKEIAWRAHYVKGNLVKKELEKMLSEGEILSVIMEGVKTAPLYMLPMYKKKKIELSGEAFILSPFDPLNVFRHRLKDFFDFDYQVECFVPAPKRKYGYFSLPVLLGDKFVARMDSKADRKKGVLIIHNIHFEKVKLDKEALGKLADAIKNFAKFNQCSEIAITKTNTKAFVKGMAL